MKGENTRPFDSSNKYYLNFNLRKHEMKKIIIILLFASNWIVTLRPSNTLISDTLRRYGVDSHIMKTREFKKAGRFNKPKDKTKNIKQKKNKTEKK